MFSEILFAKKLYIGLITTSTITHIKNIIPTIPRNEIAKYGFEYNSSILKM